jgi:hypothetical protein
MGYRLTIELNVEDNAYNASDAQMRASTLIDAANSIKENAKYQGWLIVGLEMSGNSGKVRIERDTVK